MSTEIKTGSLLSSIAKQNAPQVRDKGAGSVKSQPEKAVVALDSVSVTEKAARLQEIEDQLAAMPVVDSKKVAEIKQAIADGSYEINPERIAAKLIALETGKPASDE